MHTIKFFILATLFAVLAGCASFPQERVAPVGQFAAAQVETEKPSAFVDLKFYGGHPTEGSPVERPAVLEQLQPVVENAIKETGLFSDVTFDSVRKSDVDYTLQIKAYNHGSQGAAAVSGFITGFTFGVIPGMATDNYTVITKLQDKNGETLSSNQSDDAVRTWLGIWFIPVAANTPKKAVSETLSNQVKHALKLMVDEEKIVVAKHN